MKSNCFAHHYTTPLVPIPLFIDSFPVSTSYKSFWGSQGRSSQFTMVCVCPGSEVVMTPAPLCHIALPQLLPNFKKFIEIPCLLLSSLYSLCYVAFLTIKNSCNFILIEFWERENKCIQSFHSVITEFQYDIYYLLAFAFSFFNTHLIVIELPP